MQPSKRSHIRPSNMQRIFYFAPISSDRIDRRHGVQHDAGAARNKVLGVCSALRRAGSFPVVVTAFAPAPISDAFRGAELFRERGICFAKVFCLGAGVRRRIVAGLTLLAFSMSAIRSRDSVIFYNHFPEYFLSAFYLRIIGRPGFMDIEDAPRPDRRGPKDVLERAFFAIMMRLCAEKNLIVSKNLADSLGLQQFLPVYGVSSYFDNATAAEAKFADETVKVLYGGAVLPETGLNLFCAAVRILASGGEKLPIHFYVTGHFEEAPMRAFENEMNGLGGVDISVLSHLSMAEYRKLAKEMDVGLCLKLPSSSMGQTTFPSKVVEIAALGMLLCSTRVSDVPYIFSESDAILLKSEDPAELAAAIKHAALDRGESAEKAKRGQKLVFEKFSSDRVGVQIMEFLRE